LLFREHAVSIDRMSVTKLSVARRREAPDHAPASEPHSSTVAATELHGWGCYPVVQGRELASENLEEITRDAVLSRGLGRSYGDASLPAAATDVVANVRHANRVIHFDRENGILRAEAGLSLLELNRLTWPRGWATPVSPGTQYVTLGGMVASDVHGKNHHVDGTFGAHVTRLRLRVASGEIVECSPQREAELFRATVGGMGLTGHILEVEMRLRRIPTAWIWQETERFSNLETMIERLREAGRTWPYTLCWVDLLARGDALGRGILMLGRWAQPGEAPEYPPARKTALSVPFFLPSWLGAPWTVRLFNALNYGKHGSSIHRGIVHPGSFFYPLDVVLEWNRLYGRRGFTQYQCVFPLGDDLSRPRRFLELLCRLGGTCYVCVMKDCGAEGQGMLSFPKPGITFAIDIPVDADTQKIVDGLNERLLEEGGRIYLAKDAFTRPEHFRAMEPRLDEWLRVRRKWDPEGRLRSLQSVRVFGDRL
jgi:FAD/FMN-containing dehydrogenase